MCSDSALDKLGYTLLANKQSAADFEAYAAYVPHDIEGVLHCCNALLEHASCSSPTALPNRLDHGIAALGAEDLPH